jgi:hypothetical protein
MKMNEIIQAENLITISEFPLDHYSFEDLKGISKELHAGKSFTDYPGCKVLGTFKNLVMARWKDQYTVDLWNQATTLLITNQTSAPIPTETTPQTGVLYAG